MARKTSAQAKAIDRAVLTRRMALIGAGGLIAAALILPKLAGAENMNLSDGVAIQGYDPVAYFLQNAAVEGDASLTADFEGATYRFANADNRDAFMASPARYAPKYGGFCAYAVSKGYTAPIDPNAFTIVDGALYLNYSTGVRKIWSKDIAGNISKAEENWPKLAN